MTPSVPPRSRTWLLCLAGLDVTGDAAGPGMVLARDGSDFGARQGVRRFVRATLSPARPGPGTRVAVVVGDATWEADLEDERVVLRAALDAPAALSGWLAAHGDVVRGRAGEVATPGPAGGELPCGDVAAVLRALAAAGVDGLDLVGAPTPFPWKR